MKLSNKDISLKFWAIEKRNEVAIPFRFLNSNNRVGFSYWKSSYLFFSIHKDVITNYPFLFIYWHSLRKASFNSLYKPSLIGAL